MDRISSTIDVQSEVNKGTTFFVKLQPSGKNQQEEESNG
jgi:hypothetical protein